MSNHSADKIHFSSYDELFGIKKDLENEEGKLVNIPLSELHSFRNHPFKVVDDERMMEMTRSIEQYGVLAPAIVRRNQQGGYEIVSGHRRKRGCELAGLQEMPAIIRELTDDEATILMVDSNIQRELILPSEKAWGYRLKMEALSHQGVKGEQFTANLMGEQAGESGRTVQRYIRLTYLLPQLLEYVDQNRLLLSSGERISYLRQNEQEWVLQVVMDYNAFPSKGQAEILKEESKAQNLNQERIMSILVKKSRNADFTISVKKIRDYFPADYTKKQMEDVILKLLTLWKEEKNQERCG